MLVLRATLTVPGHRGPPVRPGFVAPVPGVDHGLDGEHVPFLHGPDGFVLGVVRDVRGAVEQRADTVAAVALDHGAVPSGRELGHLLADVPVPRPGFHRLDAFLQALVRRHAQVLRRIVHVPDEHGLVEVTVVAVDVGGDVHVEDIPALQGPRVGDSVADDFVDAGAARLWKVVVVERRRVPPVRGDVGVADLVELLGGDPGPGGADGGVQRAAGHLAAPSQDVDLPRLVLHRAVLLLRLLLRRGLRV